MHMMQTLDTIHLKKPRSYYDRVAAQSRLSVGVRVPLYGAGAGAVAAFSRVALELAVLMYLNIRLDYLRVDGYLRDYWRYWISWTVFAVGAQAYLVFYPQGAQILMPIKYFAFAAAWVYYYVGNWLILGPLKKILLPADRASAVRAYEVVVMTMWLAIQITFQVLCVATRSSPFFASAPVSVTTIAGIAMIIVGYGVKGWATCLVGFDSYFFRDILLETPNERVVSSQLYRFFRHPTYSIGYLQSYGFAVLTRSAEGLLAATALHIGILLVFVKLCEEPFMRRLYGETPFPEPRPE
jgi:protein-S-isoprenylcysteine O-methyltransferase Ste14